MLINRFFVIFFYDNKIPFSGFYNFNLKHCRQLCSAQTLVAGKIYNADYSSVIEGASVNVKCGSNTLITRSLADGTYAVRFEQVQCTLGNNVIVTSSKNGLSGSESGVIAECLSGSCGKTILQS